MTWALMGRTYTFVDTMTACLSKPVPVVANEAVGGIAVAAVLGAVLVSRRGLRPLIMKKRIAAV